ncbi:hypothetical protein GGI15_003625 [Coemansia interrupta]|uniref:Uncharacterized protein n=1 Tax=Coemansia interrupta TaxID=1126814 RepID=A0A9W8H886_9FUNG|nr:hypothetical protein GGI15_003625 [Coemansia interrupta]
MLLKSLLFFKASPSKRRKPADADRPAPLSVEHAIAQQRLPYRAEPPPPNENRRLSRATWSDGSAASNSTLISPFADDLSAMRPPSALLLTDKHPDEDDDDGPADAADGLDDEMPPLSPFFSRVPAADIRSARDTVRRASISRRNTLGTQPRALAPVLAQTPQRGTWCAPPEDPLSLAALASALDEVEWLVNQAPPLSPIFDGYEFSPPLPPPPPKPLWPTGIRRPSRPLGRRRKYAAPTASGVLRRPDRPARAVDVVAMAAECLPRVHALLALAAVDQTAAAHALFGGVPQDAAPVEETVPAVGLADTLPVARLARRSDLGAGGRPGSAGGGRRLRATASAIGLRAGGSPAVPLARRRSELPPQQQQQPAHTTQLRRRSALDTPAAAQPPQQQQQLLQQQQPPRPATRGLSRSSRSSLSSMGSLGSLGSLGGVPRAATLGQRRRVTPPQWTATPTPVRRLPPVRLHLPAPLPSSAEYAAGPMSAPARGLPPDASSPLSARHPAFARTRPDVRDLFRSPAGGATAK